MGTQFTSRLSDSDRQHIISGIRRVTREAASAAKPIKARKARTSPAPQLQRAAEAVVGVVLGVAQNHDFLEVLLESELFETVLRWLYDLRRDAHYDGFQKYIAAYGLEGSPNPVAEVSRRLGEIARGTEQPDRFRSSVTTAAKAVLADAVLRAVPASFAGASAAERLGGQLAGLHVQDIAKRYITAFLEHFLSDAMHKADTGRDQALIERALNLGRGAIHRFAKATVAKVVEQGKVNDAAAVRQIVVGELRLLLGRASPVTAA